MKRVGIDGHVLTGKYQGSRTYIENILREIGRQDQHNQYIIYSYAPEETASAFPYANFEHVPIGMRSSSARLLFYWPWAKHRHRLDILLTQYIGPPFFGGLQFVMVHDLLFESHPQFFPTLMRWRLQWLCRRSALRAERVFTVSRYSREELIRRYGIADWRIVVTPNGAPEVAPSSVSVDPEIMGLQPYLLSVGRIEPRKNVELLVRAFRAAGIAPVKLVIVGREDFGCRQVAERLAGEPGIVHLRDVSHPRLVELYRHAAGLVFPSLGEGFGIPVLEAISYGTPVIASNQTAIPEAGGSLARYFDPTAANAEEQLAAEIKKLVGHPYRIAEPLIREHVAQFTWEASAGSLIEAINGC